jgi:hypothetical protein
MKTFVKIKLLFLCLTATTIQTILAQKTATHYIYNVDFQSKSVHDLAPLFEGMEAMVAKRQDVFIRLTGQVRKTIIHSKDTMSLVAFYMPSPHLEFTASGQEAVTMAYEIERIENELKKMVFAEVNKNGKIQRVTTDSTISSTSDVLWRNVLSQMQVILPKDDVETRWETLEEEPAGQYFGVMKFDDTRKTTDSLFFIKEKAGYKRVSGSYGNLGDPSVSGTFFANISMAKTDKWIQNIQANETKFLAFKTDTTARTAIQFSAHFVENKPATDQEHTQFDALLNDTNYSQWGQLDSDPSWIKENIKHYKNILGNDNLATMTKALTELNAQNGEWNDTLYEKIKALIYLEPQNCASIEAFLTKIPTKSRAFSIVANALAAIDNTPSELVLSNLITRYATDWDALYELLPLIYTLKNPELFVEKSVKVIAFGKPQPRISSTAQLALASIAGNLKKQKDERGDKLTAEIIAQLKGKVSDDQYILVMGNIGSAASFEQLKPFLKDPSVEMRCLAISNLRLIPLPEIDAILAQFASENELENIKKVAIETINFRKGQ